MEDSTVLSEAGESLLEYGALGAVLLFALFGLAWIVRHLLTKQAEAVNEMTAGMATANAHLKSIDKNMGEIKDDFDNYRERTDAKLIEHEGRIRAVASYDRHQSAKFSERPRGQAIYTW